MNDDVNANHAPVQAPCHSQQDAWDAINRKKAKVFYYVFTPIAGLFALLNFLSGFHVVSSVEVLAFVAAIATFARQEKLKTEVFLHLSVVYITVVTFTFLFFPAVGNSAYLWAIGLPFFTSYLVGSKGTMYWSLSFLLLALLVGSILFFQGYPLYWRWEMAPFIALPYIVSAVFSIAFARYVERYIEDLKQSQAQSAKAASALKESEEKYRTLLQSSMNAVAVHRDGVWVYANPACLQLLGAKSFDELAGKSVLDVVAPSHHAMVKERIEEMRQTQKPLPTVEEHFVRLNGDTFPAEVSAAPIVFEGKPAYMITIRDLSELKAYEERQHALQAQLEHAQRLEALGVLAGGIAHDFNNLLAAIAGNAELLRQEVSHIESAQTFMDHIDESCSHAADLCRQMLAYAGKGKYVVDVVDLNALVRSMSKLMRASVSSSIRLGIKLDDDLPMIEADVSQIKQVILNFIVNSADAIGDHSGRIQVSTFVRQVSREKLISLYNGVEMREGQYVVLEVKDSGCGMPEALQKKIFDPFVTTKEKGTGLGLSAVLGIIKAHHGGLELRSEEGVGTVFRVFLPPSSHTNTTSITIETGEIHRWHGSGWVLIVDDDVTVRDVMKSFVQRLGFDVLEAEDGRAGVDMFKQYHHKLKAVLMDMTMPRLGGLDALHQMRNINPDVPIIMMSGYTETEMQGVKSGEQPDGFVQKPFRFKDVKKVLYQVLEK